MSGFVKNLMGASVALLMLLGVLFGMQRFLDPVLGAGGTAVITLVLAGIGLGAGLLVIGIMITNLVHRTAGEDLTMALGDTVKAISAGKRVEQEWARAEREAAGYQGKIEVINHKALTAQAQKLANIQAAAERERVKAEYAAKYARAEQDSGQTWVDSVFVVDDDEGSFF